MRHTIVARAAAGLAVALLVGAVAFAWLVRGRPAVSGDAFARRCGSCHTADDVAGHLRMSGDARGAIEAFLIEHSDATPDEVGLILDYFASTGSSTGK